MEIERITRQQHHASAAQRLQMVEQFRRSGLARSDYPFTNCSLIIGYNIDALAQAAICQGQSLLGIQFISC